MRAFTTRHSAPLKPRPSPSVSRSAHGPHGASAHVVAPLPVAMRPGLSVSRAGRSWACRTTSSVHEGDTATALPTPAPTAEEAAHAAAPHTAATAGTSAEPAPSTAPAHAPPPSPVSSSPPAPSAPSPSSTPSPFGFSIQTVQPRTSLLVSPSFSTPSSSSADAKPYMLLLPDLDGVGMTSKPSWPALSETFHLQALQLSPQDNSATFADLVQYVVAHVKDALSGAPPERPTYLLGEGFGAVVALAASLQLPHLIHRLVLVNPSTSYLTSPLRRLEPLLARAAASGAPTLELGLPLVLAPALVASADPLLAASQVFQAPIGQGSEVVTSSSSSSSNSSRSTLISAEAVAALAQGAVQSLLRRGPAEVAGDAVRLAAATLEQVREISSRLPPRALAHRLSMLADGLQQVTPQLENVEQRAMILIGGRDPVLPSKEEGTKLLKEMQRAFVKLLPESGHCPLSEPSVDVLELMRQEGFLLQRRIFSSPAASTRRLGSGSGFGSAGPLEVPTLEEVRRAGAEWTASIRSYCSPVFFSTLPDGRIVEGLEGLPADDEDRPLLVVGNHQLYAFDMNIMVEEVLLKRGILLRGLAHPSLFSPALGGSSKPSSSLTAGAGKDGAATDSDGESASSSQAKAKASSPTSSSRPKEEKTDNTFAPRAMANTFRTFGAVEVSAKNFFRLLQGRENVLLYPGGVREGFKRKNEKYELFWPAKPEFVRMAARFSATVVPLSAIGLEDSISLVLDSDELVKNPLLGSRSRELAEATRSARAGVSLDPDHDQSFVPPIIAPGVPARLYFLFGKPIKLTIELYDDRAAAQEVYQDIRAQVEDGIGYLLRKREQDPYRDFIPRWLYENPPALPLGLGGGGDKRKAPTFTP